MLKVICINYKYPYYYFFLKLIILIKYFIKVLSEFKILKYIYV